MSREGKSYSLYGPDLEKLFPIGFVKIFLSNLESIFIIQVSYNNEEGYFN